MEDQPEQDKKQPEEVAQEAPKEAPAETTPEPAVEKAPEAPVEETSRVTPKKPAEDVSASDKKVIGIPVQNYVKICYLLILTASGFGVFTNFVGIVGVYVPGGQLFGILGITGLALSLIGWQAFAKEFKPNEITHFKYMALLFVAFFVIYLVLSGGLGWFGFFGAIIAFLIAAVQFGCIYTGFSLWKADKEASKENLIGEFEAMKSFALSKINKNQDDDVI